MLISMSLVMLLLLSFSSLMIAAAPDTIRIWASTVSFDAVINSDTIAGGYVKPNTVFLLQNTGSKDTSFLSYAPITVKGNITVIGKVNPVTGKPPVIMPGIRQDNSSIGDYFEPQGNDTLTLKGLYFVGTRADSASNTGRFVVPVGDYHVFYFDHCVLENIVGPQATPNLFDTWAHAHCSFYITNCEFRNSVHDSPGNPGFAWTETGDPIAVPCDTAIFRNNTFFCFGGLVLGGGSRAPIYLDFEHNTMYNTVQQGIFQLYNMNNAVVRNNVFWNVGSTSQPTSWGNPAGSGKWFSGLITLDTLSDTLLTTPFMPLTEAGRSINITNNVYCWPPQDTVKWNTYSCQTMVFVSAIPGMGTDKVKWPLINIANNDSTDPGFNPALDTLAADAMAPLIDLSFTLYSANGYRPYLYKMPPITDPAGVISWEAGIPSNWATTQGYPVPENLRYSSTTLAAAGTDGKALGDLNWFPEQITAVSKTLNSLPAKFELSQNYPNPFNPSTKISYTLAAQGMTRLSVFDILGREVAVLVNEVQNVGSHNVTFTANNLSSGVYFYKLMSSETTTTLKMILMK
jgi:hypothetical protein